MRIYVRYVSVNFFRVVRSNLGQYRFNNAQKTSGNLKAYKITQKEMEDNADYFQI